MLRLRYSRQFLESGKHNCFVLSPKILGPGIQYSNLRIFQLDIRTFVLIGSIKFLDLGKGIYFGFDPNTLEQDRTHNYYQKCWAGSCMF